MEESPFKTPSKFSMCQVLPSSGSSSPFTPKRSRIVRKSDGELNSVSRSLKFDDSNSIHFPLNSKLDFLSLNQQVSTEYERSNFQQITPVKVQQQFDEKNKILLSPSIKNRPNRFNIVQQKKNAPNQSPSNKSGSHNSTPIKKSSDIVNCNPIDHYFKPTQKSLNFISDKDKGGENILQMENFVKLEFSTDKLELFNKMILMKKTSESLSLKNMKNKSPKKNCLEDRTTRYCNMEGSPLKTLSKIPVSQMLPSSSSSSPFTPKRSRIMRKSDKEIHSVSRSLKFEDSNSVHLPCNGKLDFLPLGQQVTTEYEQINSEQTTPVKIQQPLIQKNNKIVFSPSIKNRPNQFNVVQQEKNIIQSPCKRSGSNNSTPTKKSKRSNDIANGYPIEYYFKPTQKRPKFVNDKEEENTLENGNLFKTEFSTDNVVCNELELFNTILPMEKTSQSLNLENLKNISPTKNCTKDQSNANKNENIKNIQLLKNINVESSHKKRKKNSPGKKAIESPLSNKNIIIQSHVAEPVTPNKTINMFIMKSPNIDYLKNGIIISGGDTYSRFIKSIVLKFELLCIGNGNIIKTIYNCTNDELKIYGRLVSRKHGWIRSDEPDGLKKYKELNLCDDFDGVLTSLATKQLINTDVTSCELDYLLNILKSQELKELQKSFNINLSFNKNNTKAEMIKSFINLVKNQRTFCGNPINNLKERIKKKLGYCIKVSDESRDDIMSCLIYESYPYFNGEEKDRFRDCFSKFFLVEKKELKFPTFETKKVSVNFNTKDNLEKYKIALNLRYEVQLSLEQKNHENAIILLNVIFENFKSAVCDKCLIESLSKTPTYMRKYSAVSVYAYTLFKNISILNKTHLKKEVLEFLLQHKEFLMSKRADLHIELAKVFESQYKQLDNAAKILIDGLKDDTMSELERQMLSNRAVMYANRKVRKMNNELKTELLSLITVIKELPSVEISGKIIPKEKVSSGHKQIYSKRTENGELLWMSVEELALSHYKSRGYLNGIHDEGQFIKSMFLLCFWDIIYETYGDHILFISQYQDCPLDWRTRHFYKIREEEIKVRIAKLRQMNIDQICDMLKERCDVYYNTQSVINWKFMDVNNLPMCRTLLECLGIEVFLMIGDQILKDGRIYLYGMPDLIVWDAIRHKCIFVEVKGPNDKLSERQYSWLLKLMEFGANVEVCHVVGTGGKNITSEHMD